MDEGGAGPLWIPGMGTVICHSMGIQGLPTARPAWQSLVHPPHPREGGLFETIRVAMCGWGSADSNLRRRCEAFLSEHFPACGRPRLRCQVLWRGVLGPPGLQGRPGAGGKGRGRKGRRDRERKKGRERSRRDTHTEPVNSPAL